MGWGYRGLLPISIVSVNISGLVISITVYQSVYLEPVNIELIRMREIKFFILLLLKYFLLPMRVALR